MFVDVEEDEKEGHDQKDANGNADCDGGSGWVGDTAGRSAGDAKGGKVGWRVVGKDIRGFHRKGQSRRRLLLTSVFKSIEDCA